MHWALAFTFFFSGAVVAAVFTYLWHRKEKQLQQDNIEALKEELEATEEDAIKRTQAETLLYEARERLHQQQEQLQTLQQDKEAAEKKKYEAEKQVELARQNVANAEARMRDWEKTKEESLKAAKAAMFETGSETFRKEAEGIWKKSQTGFEEIIKSVAALSSRLSKSESLTETVWKSLATPAAVGSFSEIGLENTLRGYGLQAGRDYITQYAVKDSEGKGARPDIVVFLPANNVMVIDSKASQFFLELAQISDEKEEEAVLSKLHKTMNDHLKTLASKGYREAVKDYLQHAEKDYTPNHVYTLLFVHSESCVEKMAKADPEIQRKAQQHDIIISGPTGLGSALSLARFEIRQAQQQANQKHITDEIGKLLGALGTVLEHARKMGGGLQSAAKNYQSLTKSINSTLLPKARRLEKLGVSLPKNKSIPANLLSYDVTVNSAPTLEGEAIEEEETALLEGVEE